MESADPAQIDDGLTVDACLVNRQQVGAHLPPHGEGAAALPQDGLSPGTRRRGPVFRAAPALTLGGHSSEKSREPPAHISLATVASTVRYSSPLQGTATLTQTPGG